MQGRLGIIGAPIIEKNTGVKAPESRGVFGRAEFASRSDARSCCFATLVRRGRIIDAGRHCIGLKVPSSRFKVKRPKTQVSGPESSVPGSWFNGVQCSRSKARGPKSAGLVTPMGAEWFPRSLIGATRLGCQRAWGGGWPRCMCIIVPYLAGFVKRKSGPGDEKRGIRSSRRGG